MSLPVVIVEHEYQECQAWAAITWDNTFAEMGRTPFTIVDEVPWSKVAWLLKTIFEAQTGCTLTQEHLHFFRNYINFLESYMHFLGKKLKKFNSF